MKLRSLDLFTGYGGLTLALEPWCKPIAYVEIEEYAQKIIAYRMADGSLPRAPILADVQNIEGATGDCDIIVGGFPCQDISVAGNGGGLEGKRSGLFYEIARLTEEIQPSFVFLENVPAIRTRGLQTVIKKFSELGYDCRWTTVSASSVGAPHQRRRWFLLAHTNGTKLREQSGRCKRQDWQSQGVAVHNGPGGSVADSMCAGSQVGEKNKLSTDKIRAATPCGWWSVEPGVGRVVNGTPFRVDRIKALGNGVVPQQARYAFRKLMNIS